MARPLKKGLDYFPHDVDASSDEKIEALRSVHGNDGYAFYFILLERIYRSEDFEIRVSDAETREETFQILAKKVGVSLEKFKLILETAFRWGCFDKKIYDERGAITSRGILSRAQTVIDKREKQREQYQEKQRVSDAETPQETPQEIRQETPQSKVKDLKDLKDLKIFKEQDLTSDDVPFENIPEAERTKKKYMNRVAELFWDKYGDQTFKKVVAPLFRDAKDKITWQYILWTVEQNIENILSADIPHLYALKITGSEDNWKAFMKFQHLETRKAERGVAT